MLQRPQQQVGQRTACLDEGCDVVVDNEVDGEWRSIIMGDGFSISELVGVSDVIEAVRDDDDCNYDGRWRKESMDGGTGIGRRRHLKASEKDDGLLEVKKKKKKKRRGRPVGSKNKPKPNNNASSSTTSIVVVDSNSWSSTSTSGGAVVDTSMACSSSSSDEVLRAHVLEIAAGRDIAESVTDFVLRRRSSLCLVWATGCVRNVRLRQPKQQATAGSLEGRFDILSVGGSYVHNHNHDDGEVEEAARGFMSMSLAGEEGKVVGGSVEGAVAEGGPVLIVAALFSSSSSSSCWAAAEGEAAAGGASAAPQKLRWREAENMDAAQEPRCSWWPSPKGELHTDNKLLLATTTTDDNEEEDALPPCVHYPPSVTPFALPPPPPWNLSNLLHTTTPPPPNPIPLHLPDITIDATSLHLLPNPNRHNSCFLFDAPPQNLFLPSMTTIANSDMVLHGTIHHPSFLEWAASSSKDYLSSTRNGDEDTPTNSQPHPSLLTLCPAPIQSCHNHPCSAQQLDRHLQNNACPHHHPPALPQPIPHAFHVSAQLDHVHPTLGNHEPCTHALSDS